MKTKDELKFIREFDITKDNYLKLVDFVSSMWAYHERVRIWYGKDVLNKKCIKWYLSTAGWSGNEEIIGALKENFLWTFFWQKSVRGGHYWFELPIPEKFYDKKKELLDYKLITPLYTKQVKD